MKKKANWDSVRKIIRDWMAKTNTSQNKLAKAAVISRSIITKFLRGEQDKIQANSSSAIFSVIYKDLSPAVRQDFLISADLTPLTNKLADLQHGAVLIECNDELSPYRKGIKLYDLGMDVGRTDWAAGIHILEKAEAFLKMSHSSEAPRAGIYIAILQINLGEYDASLSNINRVENQYPGLDLGTQYELCKLRGMLGVYMGKLIDSMQWFKKCLTIADQLEDISLKPLILHKLGRVKLLKGNKLVHPSKERERGLLYSESEFYLEKAEKLDKECYANLNLAYQLLRKAQVMAQNGKTEDAKLLRKRTREVFGRTHDALHVDVEDAKLWVEDNENMRMSKRLLNNVIERREETSYAAGMALAFQILAMAKLMEANLCEAFTLAVVSICIVPSSSSAVQEEGWNLIQTNIKTHLISELGGIKAYRIYLCHLYDMAMQRLGDFVYIKIGEPKIQKQVNDVFKKLGYKAEFHPNHAFGN